MKNIKEKLVEFYCDEEGASGIEYALIAAMIAVVIASFMTDISAAVRTTFQAIEDAL